MADLTDHRLTPPLTGADDELDPEAEGAAQLVESAEELADDEDAVEVS